MGTVPKRKAVRLCKNRTAIKKSNTHNHMNVTKIIASCARPASTEALFYAHPYADIGNKKNTAPQGGAAVIPGAEQHHGFDSPVVQAQQPRPLLITEAVGKIRGALANSDAVWLPGQEQIQARLPAARNDLSFQSFLKTLGNSTKQRTGTTDNAQGAPR